jgi:hypothetical protein
LQDLSIRIETEVAKDAVDGIGLGVDGGAQLHLNSHILLQRVLNTYDPLQCPLFLVSPITDIPLNGVIPVRVLCRGGGPYSTAESRRTMRVVATTALLVL